MTGISSPLGNIIPPMMIRKKWKKKLRSWI